MFHTLLSAAHDAAVHGAEAGGDASASLSDVGVWASGGAFGALAWVLVATVVVFSGYLVMTARDIIRAATALFVSLFGVAGLYLFLGAEFLAFVQIMVYVGGTTVLIMFGVMLTARNPVEIARPGSKRVIPAIIVVALILVPLLVMLIGLGGSRTPPHWALGAPAGQGIAPQATRNLGDMLLTSYIAPFIIASFVLLIALVGAAYMVRRREEPENAEPTGM